MFFQKRQIPAVFDLFCAGILPLDHRRVFQRQYRRTGRLSPLIWFSEPRRSGPVSRRASLLKFMVGGHVLKQDIICPGQVTEETLGAAVAEFLLHIRPQRERLLDNYRGEQPVPKGEAVRGRPNNLLRVPFPRYITEVHTGYFLGLSPTLAFPAQEDCFRLVRPAWATTRW